MTTNLLLSRPQRVSQNFRREHGPMEEWSGHDFEVYMDFMSAAHRPGPVARLWLRLHLLLWDTSALPVYALSELLWAVQHRGSRWLTSAMDWLDDHCSAAESECRQAGDGELVERLGRVFDRVSRAATSAGRGLVRLARG